MDDERLKEAFRSVSLDEQSKARIWAAIEAQAPPGKENRSVKTIKTPLRVALIAAILSVLMIGTAYAAFGTVRSIASHKMPDTRSVTEIARLDELADTAGFAVPKLERFADGYVFRQADLIGSGAFGEDNELLKEFYDVQLTYMKEDAPELYVLLSPVLELPTEGEPPTPTDTRRLGGVEVKYSLDHYKFVPPDYRETEADRAAREAGHFYLSYGSDEIEERDISFASFTREGVEHVLMCSAPLDRESMYALAEELIAAYDR